MVGDGGYDERERVLRNKVYITETPPNTGSSGRAGLRPPEDILPENHASESGESRQIRPPLSHSVRRIQPMNMQSRRRTMNMKLRLTLVISLLVTLVCSQKSVRAQGASASSSDKASLHSTEATFIITGIRNIGNFLERCPTNDPAYTQIRQDFELRLDGEVITSTITCTEPISSLPIEQFTDELIALQVFRTAYYMGMGTEGYLPWTAKSLYAWMASDISGVNFKTAAGQLYCCDTINGKRYFSTSLQDASQREYKRAWPGIASSLNFYAHEIRHADAGAPGHTTGCLAFPLPTDPPGCDATYDLSNLGSYGVQYWLESKWATGYLNIGIGCSPPVTAKSYVIGDASSANDFRARFVINIPPEVEVTEPYGGPCTLYSVFLPIVTR